MALNANSRHDSDLHRWVKDIQENDKIRGRYLVKEKRLGRTRGGKPFLSLLLADRTGEVEAKVWDEAEKRASVFSSGDVLNVEGRAEVFQGKVQINVSRLNPSQDKPDPAIFLESAPGNPSHMIRSLRETLGLVTDVNLRALIDVFLADGDLISRFRKAPAAKSFHHNYLGGLLEHTLSVCQMILRVCEQYPQLDCDLLLTAGFLHDIGKIRELKSDPQIDYTDEGRLLGHLTLGVEILAEKLQTLNRFPPQTAVLLKHLIVSHHGHFEFGSPKRPKFLEAFALHLIDDLDAKINGLGRMMEKDPQEGVWTEFSRLFDRFFLKNKIVPEKMKPDEAGGQKRQAR